MLSEENTQNPIPDFEGLLFKNRFIIFFLLLGLVLILLGVSFSKTRTLSSNKIEILDNEKVAKESSEIIVEIAGQVERPGVYKLLTGSRIDDLLIAAGGISGSADRVWMDKFLNRAAKLSDGQKIYIPLIDEQSGGESAKNTTGYQTVSSILGAQKEGLININNASLSELDTLPGIGPVYGQNIIDHRPYSNIGELKSKGVLGSSLFDKIKNLITAN